MILRPTRRLRFARHRDAGLQSRAKRPRCPGRSQGDSIALGSASELDYRPLLARDLKLINSKDYAELAQRTSEVKRMLGGLLGKLNAES